ncbi:hypothetical protein SAMN05192562_101599 [Kosakonia arachidis]|uniref:Uncharacterized protein n=1 Tax=Kosakonia arachidis TaxID=551989 RepID=A0A1I6YL44_9ENTR|nr:hypothetical protein SAMN05192562_101599 [Kosakonia arachidis]
MQKFNVREFLAVAFALALVIGFAHLWVLSY